MELINCDNTTPSDNKTGKPFVDGNEAVLRLNPDRRSFLISLPDTRILICIIGETGALTSFAESATR